MVFGKKDATARKSFNLPFVANDFLEKASAVDGITQTDLITKLSMSAQIQLKAGFYLGEDKKGTPECISNIFEFYQQQRGGEMTCSKTCELIEYFVTYVLPNVNFIDEKLSNNLDYIKSNLKATLKIASPLAKLQELVQMSENFNTQSIKELAFLIKTNILFAICLTEKSSKQRICKGPRLALLIAKILYSNTCLFHYLSCYCLLKCLSNLGKACYKCISGICSSCILCHKKL